MNTARRLALGPLQKLDAVTLDFFEGVSGDGVSKGAVVELAGVFVDIDEAGQGGGEGVAVCHW